jgi:hypothetical protein
MRPIERGISPVQSFKDYYEASPYLIDRLGNYCSHCERKIETHLAVEHVLPKKPVPNKRKQKESSHSLV